MVLNTEQITEIMVSLQSIKLLLAYFSVQEVDRMADVLYSAVSSVYENKLTGSADYESWFVAVKNRAVRELADAQSYFGFWNLPQRFPLDDFLQAYYQKTYEK